MTEEEARRRVYRFIYLELKKALLSEEKPFGNLNEDDNDMMTVMVTEVMADVRLQSDISKDEVMSMIIEEWKNLAKNLGGKSD